MDMDNALFLDRLRRLRPIDDEFMRCIFRDNIPPNGWNALCADARHGA